MFFQELSGQQQQQASSVGSEFDFPEDDSAFSSSEFKEEGDFTEDHTGSGDYAGANNITAGAGHASGKQALFEGYKDPSKQFSGHTRSFHKDARYEEFHVQFPSAVNTSLQVITITCALGVADISLDFTTSTPRVTGICGYGYTVSISSASSGRTTRTPPPLEG